MSSGVWVLCRLPIFVALNCPRCYRTYGPYQIKPDTRLDQVEVWTRDLCYFLQDNSLVYYDVYPGDVANDLSEPMTNDFDLTFIDANGKRLKTPREVIGALALAKLSQRLPATV